MRDKTRRMMPVLRWSLYLKSGNVPKRPLESPLRLSRAEHDAYGIISYGSDGQEGGLVSTDPSIKAMWRSIGGDSANPTNVRSLKKMTQPGTSGSEVTPAKPK
ncbi:hypothetical protein [Nitrobacter sp.]|uniref:hypothetical protein n=1 Tax=Nitrobacter sp. TaxID=29420 RepID=UPI00345CBDB2